MLQVRLVLRPARSAGTATSAHLQETGVPTVKGPLRARNLLRRSIYHPAARNVDVSDDRGSIGQPLSVGAGRLGSVS
ncbi:hypothetical protein Hypma_000404 [Hypsizygus marmoreus]|uniref:Uncharacterized protein n=1 Tax=Hypsizygus marmoreus TaxID=39966 RepID=A0A369JG81_HYPMA|nr:hypothetical protein Hypma_000404 [Hypsizygus marmoreus]